MIPKMDPVYIMLATPSKIQLVFIEEDPVDAYSNRRLQVQELLGRYS